MTQSVVALLLLLVCEGATAMQVSRRTALASVASAPVVQLQRPAVAAGPPGEPSEGSVLKARQAFEAFDAKDLDLAERLFTETIAEWRSLGRPREELSALLVARANVRTDLKRFRASLGDLDESLEIMAVDGLRPDGRAAYVEYADAFAQRGLAHEGLAGRAEQRDASTPASVEWQRAIDDYDTSLRLLGAPQPYVLSYRGNARAALAREVGAPRAPELYEAALGDFREAEALFARKEGQNSARRNDALANQALALYALDRTDAAFSLAKLTVKRDPGLTDMRALVAAEAWRRGDSQTADDAWYVACNEISTGCAKYRDRNWLTTVRRWPQNLVDAQLAFLDRRRPS